MDDAFESATKKEPTAEVAAADTIDRLARAGLLQRIGKGALHVQGDPSEASPGDVLFRFRWIDFRDPDWQEQLAQKFVVRVAPDNERQGVRVFQCGQNSVPEGISIPGGALDEDAFRQLIADLLCADLPPGLHHRVRSALTPPPSESLKKRWMPEEAVHAI